MEARMGRAPDLDAASLFVLLPGLLSYTFQARGALWPQASNTEPPFEPPFPYLQIGVNDS